MRNLVIDQGNTSVKYAIFIEGQLKQKWQAALWNIDDILDQLTNHKIENVIYSSVAKTLSTNDKGRLMEKTNFLELTKELALPIHNAYATPATLGKDRIAAAVGAFALYPFEACLIVDAGTCMTLDVIDDGATYLGGNISPGVQMRLKAMHQFTARLPHVQLEGWDKDWGNSTQTALENGGLLGAVLEIEGLINRLQQQWPNLKCLLTGGDAQALATRLNDTFIVQTDLVLLGLNKILRYNVEKLA